MMPPPRRISASIEHRRYVLAIETVFAGAANAAKRFCKIVLDEAVADARCSAVQEQTPPQWRDSAVGRFSNRLQRLGETARERRCPRPGSRPAGSVRPRATSQNADGLPTCRPPTRARPPPGARFGTGPSTHHAHRDTCLRVAASGAVSRKSSEAVWPSAMRRTMKPPPPMFPASGLIDSKRKVRGDAGVDGVATAAEHFDADLAGYAIGSRDHAVSTVAWRSHDQPESPPNPRGTRGSVQVPGTAVAGC